MNYVLLRNYDHHAIVNDDANFIVGRAYPVNGREGPFRVVADLAPDDCESHTVAVVNLIEEAVPALTAYYDRNPPRWERENSAKTAKYTQFAFLKVEQDNQGNWLAKRDDRLLMRNNEPAIFTRCDEAQNTADAHLLDLYPGSKTIDDGLSWDPDPEIHWRFYPDRVEERAEANLLASRYLPNPNRTRLKILQGSKV